MSSLVWYVCLVVSAVFSSSYPGAGNSYMRRHSESPHHFSIIAVAGKPRSSSISSLHSSGTQDSRKSRNSASVAAKESRDLEVDQLYRGIRASLTEVERVKKQVADIDRSEGKFWGYMSQFESHLTPSVVQEGIEEMDQFITHWDRQIIRSEELSQVRMNTTERIRLAYIVASNLLRDFLPDPPKGSRGVTAVENIGAISDEPNGYARLFVAGKFIREFLLSLQQRGEGASVLSVIEERIQACHNEVERLLPRLRTLETYVMDHVTLLVKHTGYNPPTTLKASPSRADSSMTSEHLLRASASLAELLKHSDEVVRYANNKKRHYSRIYAELGVFERPLVDEAMQQRGYNLAGQVATSIIDPSQQASISSFLNNYNQQNERQAGRGVPFLLTLWDTVVDQIPHYINSVGRDVFEQSVHWIKLQE